MSKHIRRAHSLILVADGDSVRDMANMLSHLARTLLRDEPNLLLRDKPTEGSSGGIRAGCTYSYKHDPSMTHDRFFLEIEAEIAEMEKAAQS